MAEALPWIVYGAAMVFFAWMAFAGVIRGEE